MTKIKSIVTLTTNMSDLVREDTLDGVDHYVVPVVLMAAGVHNGIYYPAEELKKSAMPWNGQPIPINHPTDDHGVNISCNQKDIIEKQVVGQLLNVNYDDNLEKLIGEAWITKSKAETIEPRVVESFEANKMMEVSTGLFTDNVEESGVWKGEPYNHIAVNHRPDHLALLPDTTGACSIADGAGLLRVNEDKKGILDKIKNLTLQVLEQSHDQIWSDLNMAIPKGNWVQEVFSSHFIFHDDNGNLFKQSYTKTDDKATPTGEAQKVERRVDFVVVNQETTESSEPPPEGDTTMDKTAKVEALIVNSATKFGPENREWLSSCTDEQLDSMAPAEAAAPVEPTAPVKEAPVVNKEDKPAGTPFTKEDAMSMFSEMLVNERAANKNNDRIARLVANEVNVFNEDQLRGMDAEQLQKYEAQITPGNYAGRGQSGDLMANQTQGVPDMPECFPENESK